jgi:PfaB family protein
VAIEKIAVIGISCLFPDAQDPDQFWQNLIAGKNTTSSITTTELGVDPALFYDPVKGQVDKTYSLQGGLIRDFKFDATGYALPPAVLEQMDPLGQAALYASRQALQHGGYWGNTEALERCGLILGNLTFPTRLSNQVFAPIYQAAIEPTVRELLQLETFQLAGSAAADKIPLHNAMTASLPTLLASQALSLSPVHFCLDAACASSLYAIKLACHYLRSHKVDSMLAGAISYADPLFIRMLFSGVHAYPDNGISHPLDKRSRGLTPSDGVGLLMLKRYSDAVRDGDTIHAIISGVGLSNDGKGKHLLSPNQQGQVLAFERAYHEAGLNPQAIDYLECHATGTLLGDTTELSSIDTFFGACQANLLVGSAKSNVGHLLTAAGMVGLIKVILGMEKGCIPPTINLAEPMESPQGVIKTEQIVQSETAWPQRPKPGSVGKAAAVSAFGFGGTNAHLIVERSLAQVPAAEPPIAPAQLAIIGMDAHFGAFSNLDAFERSIYDGQQAFVPLPAQRWKGLETHAELLQQYGLETDQAPVGAYIEAFEIDPLRSKIPPNEVDTLNPQQLLMLKVADRALQDAGIREGQNVAVIIALETEPGVHQLQERWHLPWQVNQGIAQAGQGLAPEAAEQLSGLVKDSLHPPARVGEYLGYVGNITASRISALWHFQGPAFTISAGENSVFKALETAQLLMAAGEVEAVVVGAVDLAGGVENVLLRSQLAKLNRGVATLSYDAKADGWVPGEGAGAVVLSHLETARQQQSRIYAVVDALGMAQAGAGKDAGQVTASTIQQAAQQAYELAGVTPDQIHYLEVYGSGMSAEDTAEVDGLLQLYQGSGTLRCALGSVKANIGHTYVASGIASLIKTALCLYHRYIPAVPGWSGPKQSERWQESPFYMASQSRGWYLANETDRRIAAINSLGWDGTCAHIVLSEEPEQAERQSRYLQQRSLHLFPVAATNRDDLIEQLTHLQQQMETCDSLAALAHQTFETYQGRTQSPYALTLVGANKKSLLRDLQRAVQGVTDAFDHGKDWQTPSGSYFTANPLASQGEVAFVYPGAFGAYLGIGQNLFRLFPKIYDDPIFKQVGNRVASVEQLLYPRSLQILSNRQREALETQLLSDPIAMFETEMAIASLTTTILQDYFQIMPQRALGYSLGETSMMAAQGVFANAEFGKGINSLNQSSLFSDRLSGPKNAVRDYWGLPTVSTDDGQDLWCNYVLMAAPAAVREAIKSVDRVYLTQINTPNEVVIAGAPKACKAVIQALGCNAFRAPFNHVIHCPPMASEYDELVNLNTLSVQPTSPVTFYSAATYQAIDLEGQEVAQKIAQNLCQQLDFPRLVNQIYADGARIFLEVGAGGTCSRWISEILKPQPHVTIPLNMRGMDDHTSILRALARLISHRVPLDLSTLYTKESSVSGQRAMVRTVQLGGARIADTILKAEHKARFQGATIAIPAPDDADSSDAGSVPPEKQPAPEPVPAPAATASPQVLVPIPEAPVLPQTNGAHPKATDLEATESAAAAPETLEATVSSPVATQPLQQTNAVMSQAHLAFLTGRKAALQELQRLIELHLKTAGTATQTRKDDHD